jgi:hypothetical protein
VPAWPAPTPVPTVALGSPASTPRASLQELCPGPPGVTALRSPPHLRSLQPVSHSDRVISCALHLGNEHKMITFHKQLFALEMPTVSAVPFLPSLPIAVAPSLVRSLSSGSDLGLKCTISASVPGRAWVSEPWLLPGRTGLLIYHLYF